MRKVTADPIALIRMSSNGIRRNSTTTLSISKQGLGMANQIKNTVIKPRLLTLKTTGFMKIRSLWGMA